MRQMAIDEWGDVRLKTHACVSLRFLVYEGRCKCWHTLTYISKLTGTRDVVRAHFADPTLHALCRTGYVVRFLQTLMCAFPAQAAYAS